MKKLYFLFIFFTLSVSGIIAQTHFDYYVYFTDSNKKIYFGYVDGQYVTRVAKLDSGFKIYSLDYKPEGTDQDKYIFGRADGQRGIAPDTEIKLSNPGNILSVEGGGTLYGVTLIFDPSAMTLKIVGGSSVRNHRTLEIGIISDTASGPEDGELTFSLEYTHQATSPVPDKYQVTASYTNYARLDSEMTMELTNDNMTGTFSFTDLIPGEVNTIKLTATAIAGNEELSTTALAPIITPDLPILIGQIEGHEWQADYGIHGNVYTDVPGGKTYYYSVNLTGNGEFRFVSKLGNSASDWDTVDSNCCYAPATSRVAAPEKTWMPYTLFASGGTSSAWYPENFEAGPYIVEFDYASKSIAVVKGDIPTGVDDVVTDTAPAKVDVYSISGIPVRENVDYRDATAGLPHGLYIVNGKKIAVR